MKFVLAPDSFKESMTAWEACEAMERGLRTVFPDAQFVKVPMADGGEGTVQSLVDATGGRVVQCEVTGPLGNKVTAFYGILGDGRTAVIEMAAASGLALVPKHERNPLHTTTRGTGELILHALDQGVSSILMGLGGSATNDGGMGMAQALGYQFLREDGSELGYGGGALSELSRIDASRVDPRLQELQVVAACDVDNPLTGKRGASAIFGPQKGATPNMVELLDASLGHLADVIERDLNMQVRDTAGAGAAGGLGAGVMAFLQATLKSGVDIVIEATGLADKLQGADVVLTGEGQMDSQTAYGKTPIGVAKTAKLSGVPVIALAGSLGTGVEAVHEHGIDMIFSIVPGVCTIEEALQNASLNMERTARNVGALISFGKS